MQTVDSIINARWIIPVEPANTVYDNHSLIIDKGKIIDILETDLAQTKYHSNSIKNLNKHVLIPGLVNAHTHSPMSLLRGLADDIPLMEWLQQHIWPAEQRMVDYEFVQQGSELAIAEMLRSGTTTFNDMYFFPEATAKVVDATGIRASLGMIVIDFPSNWAAEPEEYFRKGLELHDKYKSHPLISTCFAPHAPYTVGDEGLKKIQILSEQLEVPIHIHLHESQDEVSQATEGSGLRPIQRLKELGLLSPYLNAVHMTQLSEDDIHLVAETGLHVIHCPESNMKLASGICPVKTLLDNNINVALGTDGAASNNDLDMLAEMRSASLLAKVSSGDATAVAAETALRMATLNGAKALGLGDITGSLEIGKAADICAVELENIESIPIYHPISQLVYSVGRENVRDVWVQGKHLLNNRELTTIDIDRVIENTNLWHNRIYKNDSNYSA